MKRSLLLSALLVLLLGNLALTATNRLASTEEANAAPGTLHVVLEPSGGGSALRNTENKLGKMLDLLQNMERNTRQLTLLGTNSAPGQAAATEHELKTLQQILVELQRRR
jgi:hypothetical protein